MTSVKPPAGRFSALNLWSWLVQSLDSKQRSSNTKNRKICVVIFWSLSFWIKSSKSKVCYGRFSSEAQCRTCGWSLTPATGNFNTLKLSANRPQSASDRKHLPRLARSKWKCNGSARSAWAWDRDRKRSSSFIQIVYSNCLLFTPIPFDADFRSLFFSNSCCSEAKAFNFELFTLFIQFSSWTFISIHKQFSPQTHSKAVSIKNSIKFHSNSIQTLSDSIGFHQILSSSINSNSIRLYRSRNRTLSIISIFIVLFLTIAFRILFCQLNFLSTLWSV